MIYVLLASRLFVGMLFLWSFTSKVRHRARFTDFTAAAKELAPELPTAVVVPVVLASEAAIVIAVAIPATVALGFAIALALLGAFTVGLASAIRKERRVSCQCFGASTTQVGPAHIVRNLLLVLGAVTGILAEVTVRP